MKNIIVTGAGGGGSNNLIRGIKESGYPVYIVGTNLEHYYLARSLADKNFLIPSSDSPDAYIDALHMIITREQIDLIIPNSDREVRVISKYREQLGVLTFLPSHEIIEVCQDKYILHDKLSKQGIRVAETYAIDDLKNVDEIFTYFEGSERLWCRMRKGSGSKGSLPVKHPEQVRFWVQYWQDMRDIPEGMFLLCEYLPGRDYAFQSLWNNGKLVIAKTCERLSYLFGEYMPSGSSSTPRIGKLVNNPAVKDMCTQAIKSIAPHATGMYCVDLKESREGTPCITEINIGRFFMITPAFNAVGRHNMAELYLKLAFGDPITVGEHERFSDIGSDETFLLRELDNEPLVISAKQMKENYISLM